jgi:hypothetical protein
MQLAVFFGVGIFAFGMSVEGSLFLVALIGILVILFSVGLGLLVSNFVRSRCSRGGDHGDSSPDVRFGWTLVVDRNDASVHADYRACVANHPRYECFP